MDKPQKHRSIGQRMIKAKSLEARRDVGLDWAASWIEEHDTALSAVERAVRDGDLHEIGYRVSKLREHSEKRLLALPNIISKLADEDI